MQQRTKPSQYVCFSHHEHRKTLFIGQGTPHCPICGEAMVYLGRTARIPKKDDMENWKWFKLRVRRYFTIQGWKFPEENPEYPDYEPKEKNSKRRSRKTRQTYQGRRDRRSGGSYH